MLGTGDLSELALGWSHLRRGRPDVALQRQRRGAEDADPAPDPLGGLDQPVRRRRRRRADRRAGHRDHPGAGADRRGRAGAEQRGDGRARTRCRTSPCSTCCATASGRRRSRSWPGTPGTTRTAGTGRSGSRSAGRPSYSLAEIRRWLEVFAQRFYAFSQFKRSALPNGPKVSAGGSLSPRGDWRAPSDMSARIWLEDVAAVPTEWDGHADTGIRAHRWRMWCDVPTVEDPDGLPVDPARARLLPPVHPSGGEHRGRRRPAGQAGRRRTGGRAEMAGRVKEYEVAGDELTHEIMVKVNKTFVTPFDREDIHRLASALDDVLDAIEEAADRIVLYRLGMLPAGDRRAGRGAAPGGDGHRGGHAPAGEDGRAAGLLDPGQLAGGGGRRASTARCWATCSPRRTRPRRPTC